METCKKIFEYANKRFLDEEKRLILSGVSERALCGSLMLYFRKELDETTYHMYHVDIEYNRNDGRIKTIIDSNLKVITITCDLIVHSRGEIVEQDNLIALEVKKSTAPEVEKIKDKERLIALTIDTFDEVWSYDGKTFPEHVCRYKLGVYYEVNIKERLVYIEYYVKGQLYKQYEVSF